MITHITTNLSASELEAFYGNRVRSRLREMFNLLIFENETGNTGTNVSVLSEFLPFSIRYVVIFATFGISKGNG